MEKYLAPSLACMDISDTKNNLKAFEKHCRMLHIDIMDGHFARNIMLSPDYIKFIRPHSSLEIDAHMMVEYPQDYISALASAGATYMSVHAEAVVRDSFRVFNSIKNAGMKIGVALCPATPLEAIECYADMIDMLTIMTVEVGYSGQKFIPQMLKKIEKADTYRKANGLNYLMQVDGNVGPDNQKALFDRNVDVFVMGSNMFKGEADPFVRCARVEEEFLNAVGLK